jgi:hypothetical protein
MSLELTVDLWEELKRYVNVVDRSDAADNLVAIMIDHDYAAEDILSVFSYDPDIKRALSSYLAQEEVEEFDEYDDEPGYDDN